MEHEYEHEQPEHEKPEHEYAKYISDRADYYK